MVQITDGAVHQFKAMAAESKEEGLGVRFTVTQGCCGSSFALEFSKTGKPGDSSIAKDGLRFYIAPEAATLLERATIDFKETPQGKNFVIKGLPKPSSSGCC